MPKVCRACSQRLLLHSFTGTCGAYSTSSILHNDQTLDVWRPLVHACADVGSAALPGFQCKIVYSAKTRTLLQCGHLGGLKDHSSCVHRDGSLRQDVLLVDWQVLFTYLSLLAPCCTSNVQQRPTQHHIKHTENVRPLNFSLPMFQGRETCWGRMSTF